MRNEQLSMEKSGRREKERRNVRSPKFWPLVAYVFLPPTLAAPSPASHCPLRAGGRRAAGLVATTSFKQGWLLHPPSFEPCSRRCLQVLLTDAAHMPMHINPLAWDMRWGDCMAGCPLLADAYTCYQ
ncbi:hypothetical protein GQ54DRAFT_172891 [Martensiomyces pterosporus]|nr:hypothetical protein GQ54DRAFT_172891 [Martensiomyces pterosporus]